MAIFLKSKDGFCHCDRKDIENANHKNYCKVSHSAPQRRLAWTFKDSTYMKLYDHKNLKGLS